MKNLSNNYGNLMFLDPEAEAEGNLTNTVPIGKEEIRIPISISPEKNEKRIRQEGKILVSSAVCPITGISISLLVPNLPISFDYENPIGRYRNAIKISQLSRREQLSLSEEILAGTILSLLEAAGLVEKTFSYRAWESNRILSSLTKGKLVECLYSVKKVVESKADKRVLAERLPHITFCRDTDFPAYVQTIMDITFPKPKAEPEAKVSIPVQTKKVSARLQITVVTAIKRMTKSLQADGIISNKAAGIFLWLMTDENIQTMTAEQKAKYILYLTEKNNETANKLAVLFSAIDKGKEVNLEDEVIPEDAPKISFLEQLAQRKAKGKQNG
jgi:hypothetical protein